MAEICQLSTVNCQLFLTFAPMTAKNNRTLRLEEGEREDLMPLVDGRSLIHGDILDVLPTLPDGFAKLIIVDPPYNLSRNFGGNKFTTLSSEEYEEYLRGWFHPLCDKLAPNGTLYMCGDWRCSSSMQRVIEERLTILNRITWQREKGRGAAQNWKNSMEDIWFAVKNPKDYVFNLDIPESANVYLHRAGRTARAGAKGRVVTLADEKESLKLEALEQKLGISLKLLRKPRGARPVKKRSKK